MWSDKRFIATRDPMKGGLHIAAVTPAFKSEDQFDIENNCLELIAKDMETPCVCLYALRNGGYMAAMALKVAGSRKEPRSHEIIRGIILGNYEMTWFCSTYMSDVILKEVFFHGPTDPDAPEDWIIPSEVKEFADRKVPDPVERMECRNAIGLCNALKLVEQKRLKIQLIVPDRAKIRTLSLLGCMEKMAGVRLFIMANGECTMRGPDILIYDEPVYQDMRGYRRMTMEEFIHMGSDPAADIGSEMSAAAGEMDEDKHRAEDMVKFCMRYISDTNISDHEMQDAWMKLKQSDSWVYALFLSGLRRELSRFRDVTRYWERYMKLLYPLFRKNNDVCADMPSERALLPEIVTAPYDYNGMYLFLKKKSKSQGELRTLIRFMLECQFRECIAGISEKIIREAAVDTVKVLR